jgi:hypothetical protein
MLPLGGSYHLLYRTQSSGSMNITIVVSKIKEKPIGMGMFHPIIVANHLHNRLVTRYVETAWVAVARGM